MTRTTVISQPLLSGVQMYCPEVVGFCCLFFSYPGDLPFSFCLILCERSLRKFPLMGRKAKEKNKEGGRGGSQECTPFYFPNSDMWSLEGMTRTVVVLEIPECRSPAECLIPQVEGRVECGCRWEAPMPSHVTFQPARMLLYPTSSFDLGMRSVIIYKALSCTLLPMLSPITIIYAFT